jgi:diguanylate cyclase (GGDEF) domain
MPRNRRRRGVGLMLTGLANRRQCLALVESELARHRRSGRPVVLVILDIDHSKSINDRYDHPDDALYRAKLAGRNRFVVAAPDAAPR